MEVTYTLLYIQEVGEKDIPKLSSTNRKRIRQVIEDKLVRSPETFGKPLRRSLQGYRSLRIGDYRVVFKIEPSLKQVIILFIGHRSSIYKVARDKRK